MSEEIRILITDATSDDISDSAPVATAGAGKGGTAMSPTDEESAEKVKKTGAVAEGLVAVREITPFISQAMNFQVSQIEITTGSAEAQRKAQTMVGVISKGGGILVAVMTGGPYAAAIAALTTALQEIFTISQRYAEIQNDKRIESENLALRKSRLGMATNRSRTGGVS